MVEKARERWWRKTQTGTEHRSRARQSRSIVCASEEGGLRRSLERRYLDLLRRDVFDWIEGSSGGGRRFNRLVTMLRQTSAHAESVQCEHSSLREHVSDAPMGRARSAAGHAPGNEAVAHRIECFADRGGTTARGGPGSPQNQGIPLCVRQSDHGESRQVATRSGAP